MRRGDARAAAALALTTAQVERAFIAGLVVPDDRGGGLVTDATPLAFGDIGSPADTFEWLRGTLVPLVTANKDYNGRRIDYAFGAGAETERKHNRIGTGSGRSGRVFGYNRIFFGVHVTQVRLSVVPSRCSVPRRSSLAARARRRSSVIVPLHRSAAPCVVARLSPRGLAVVAAAAAAVVVAVLLLRAWFPRRRRWVAAHVVVSADDAVQTSRGRSFA